MTEDRNDQSKKMGEVIKKAWGDEAFKARLLADARAVLEEHGIPVPEGMDVKAVENSKTLLYVVIPVPPSNALNESDLGAVSGGWLSPDEQRKLPPLPPAY